MSDIKDTETLAEAAVNDSTLNDVAGGTALPGLQKKSEFYDQADCLFNRANDVFTPANNVVRAAGECLDTETGTATPRGKIKL